MYDVLSTLPKHFLNFRHGFVLTPRLNLFEKIFSGPATSFAAWAGVVISGWQGSMYGNEFAKNIWNINSSHVLTIWIVLGLTAVLSLFHSIASNSVDEKHKEAYLKNAAQLSVRTDQIYDLYRTMPPEGFLIAYSNMYKTCKETVDQLKSRSSVTKVEIELAIRHILFSICALTKTYDKAIGDVRYAANIMLFTDGYKTNTASIPTAQQMLKFLAAGTDILTLKGILVLLPSLTTSTTGALPIPDDQITSALALPVPNASKDPSTQKFIALPGAPLSLLENYTNQYRDTDMMGTWMASEGDFTIALKNEVNAYFSSPAANSIKSFVSFPLPFASTNPHAVLNIHCDVIGILDDKVKRNLFEHVMTPLFSALWEVVDTYRSNHSPF